MLESTIMGFLFSEYLDSSPPKSAEDYNSKYEAFKRAWILAKIFLQETEDQELE